MEYVFGRTSSLTTCWYWKSWCFFPLERPAFPNLWLGLGNSEQFWCTFTDSVRDSVVLLRLFPHQPVENSGLEILQWAIVQLHVVRTRAARNNGLYARTFCRGMRYDDKEARTYEYYFHSSSVRVLWERRLFRLLVSRLKRFSTLLETWICWNFDWTFIAEARLPKRPKRQLEHKGKIQEIVYMRHVWLSIAKSRITVSFLLPSGILLHVIIPNLKKTTRKKRSCLDLANV